MYTTKSFYLKFLQTNTTTYKNRTGFMYPPMVISLYIYSNCGYYIYVYNCHFVEISEITALGPFALRQQKNFSTTAGTSSSGIKPLLVVVSTPP